MHYLKQKSRDKSDLTSLRKVKVENSQNIHSEAVLSLKISKTGLNIYAFFDFGNPLPGVFPTEITQVCRKSL